MIQNISQHGYPLDWCAFLRWGNHRGDWYLAANKGILAGV
ncbi:hypothetical protein DLM_1352 [Aquitalea magnusonii]|uniref:Uncharacterized protein n=1 Tax=Aquitalea magnusonii TaxID=332411 RepID=A0A3G9GHH8_9NEIS|nr:hypothetical protein DLM_1352 [Aquitalea magnusonii]